MRLHWVDLVVMLAMVVAACASSYFLLLRKLRQSLFENHREMERRLSSLTKVIAMLEGRLSEAAQSTEALVAEEIETGLVTGGAAKPVLRETEPIAAEIQVAIAAIAVALLGHNARVRSARLVSSRDAVSPWTQQGRVLVQSSHNLRTRG